MSQEVETCYHVMPNGEYCEAVAMTDSDYCYYHHRDHQRRANIMRSLQLRRRALARDAALNIPPDPENLNQASATLFQSLDLPLLDSRLAIQVTITNLLRAIATRQIETKHAALMLYGLQIAVSNIRPLMGTPDEHTEVTVEDLDPLPSPLEVDAFDPCPLPSEAQPADSPKKRSA